MGPRAREWKEACLSVFQYREELKVALHGLWQLMPPSPRVAQKYRVSHPGPYNCAVLYESSPYTYLI